MRIVRAWLSRTAVWVAIITASLISVARTGHADSAPVAGSDSIVVYNKSMEPIRRLANLPSLTTCGSASGDSLAIGHPNSTSVVLLDGQGIPRAFTKLGGQARRIAGYKDGYLVVSEHGVLFDIGLDGKIKREDNSIKAVNILPHPQQQGMIVARAFGDVALISPDGRVTAHYGSDTAGRAVSITDIALEDNSTIVALDSAANELIALDLSLKELRRTPAPFDIKEVVSIHSTSPSLTALVKDKNSARFFRSDGTTSVYKSKNPITCAVGLGDETIGLGASSQNPVYAPAGYFADLDGYRPELNATSLFAVICYGLIGSLAFVFAWKTVTRGRRQAALDRGADEPPSPSHVLSLSFSSKILGSLIFLIAIGGLYLSWRIYPQLRTTGSLSAWGYYWLGAILSATSLVCLGYMGNLYQGLARVRPPTEARQRDSISWVLVTLAVASVVAVHYLTQNSLSPRWIVAIWLAGQVFFVSAFTRAYRAPRWSWGEKLSLLALLAITLATRLYKWTECPPNIHFDFGIIDAEALALLYENWNPLFELRAGQTIGKAWLLQMAASMWLFGVQEWATRVPSVIWMVGLVWACYLLGRETVSHRFGLIFGILVIAQHNLLAYSRLPYVIESTAPFVFCLYYACRGLKRGSMRDWVVAGAWAGWSMMTVRTFTTFPLIGAGILIYFCLFHLRTLWANRANLVAMAAAATVVFSPNYYFYASQQHLSFRLAGSSPLLADYKLNTDLSLWMAQMGAAFGAILRYADKPPWPSESADPICLALTGSLFGAGLLVLLLRARSLASPVSLFAMAGSIAFGSGFLTNPPSYYHHFVGLVFVMFVVAVPLECLSQVIAAVRPKIFIPILASAVCAMTALAVQEQVRPFMNFCGWSLDGTGNPLGNRHVYSVLSDRLLSRRDNIFVMVAYPKKTADFHHANCSIFYGQFSERHEIVNPIKTYLPIRPSARPKPVEFMALYNPEYLDEVKKAYPGGVEETISFAFGQGTLYTYTVKPEQVAATYAKSLSTGDLLDREHYGLTPLN